MSLLVIESTDEIIRAAIVKKTFKGGYRISNLIKIKREDGYEILTENEIRIIKMMVGDCPKSAVIVSNSVTLIELFMDKDKVKQMRGNQLKEAMKWEVEQYVPDNIVGYEVCRLSKKEMENEEQVRIWVSALPKSEYDQLKEILLREDLKLKNIYPMDACFPMAKLPGDSKDGMIAVNLGERTTKMTYVKNKNIMNFKEIPMGTEDIFFNIENQTASEVNDIIAEAFEQMSAASNAFIIREYADIQNAIEQIDLGKEKILVSGTGASNKIVLDFLERSLSSYVDIVDIDVKEDIGKREFSETEFSSILGAGIRQLSIDRRLRTVGINDAPDILTLMKERPDISAAATVAILVFVLGTNYTFMKYKIYKNNNEIKKLESIKRTHEALESEYSNLKEQENEVLEKIETDNEKITFLLHELDEKREYIVSVLRGIKGSSNIDLRANSIEPIDAEASEFTVKGQSDSLSSINRLVSGLQSQPWCSYARVIHVIKGSAPKEQPSESDKPNDSDESDESNESKESSKENNNTTNEVKSIPFTFELKVVLNQANEGSN